MIEPNYIYQCLCTKVSDGDTATFDVDLGFKFMLRGQGFRFYGINTPELTSKVPATAKRALEAKRYVALNIEGKTVNVQFFKNTSTSSAKVEKYGRYLAVVFYMLNGQQVNLNKQLIDLGMAKEYLP